jgi:hypothetical protein
VPKRTRIAFITFLACAVAAAPAAARGHRQEFKVSSTLAGKKVLPHRIHWLGFPRIAESKVTEVDFLIDDKVRWIEHNPPYTYGFDGNYLVTSWLTPGRHNFTVRVTARGGLRGRSSKIARVLAAKPPPAQLAGTWKRTVKAGTWRLSSTRSAGGFVAPVEPVISSTSATSRPACSRRAGASTQGIATRNKATTGATSPSSRFAIAGRWRMRS